MLGVIIKQRHQLSHWGVIPNKEIKKARQHLHRIIDLLWKNKKVKRRELYKKISDYLGYEYHTAEIRTIEEGRKVYKFVRDNFYAQ